MSYSSISPLRHRYLKRGYLDNRHGEYTPLECYQTDADRWARTSSERMHEHCQDLLKVLANPVMLNEALHEIGWRIGSKGYPDNLDLSGYQWPWLRDIQRRILDGTFRRGPYHKVVIPKPGKSGTRTIEVPEAETRIVARNLSNILVPLLDPDFMPLSIGFRPKRSVLHGLAAAEELLKQGMTHWVACDIKDAFGQLPKQRALQLLESKLKKSPVMWVVEEILDRHRKRGVPQGIAISPLLLNLYLDHNLDSWWLKNQTNSVMVRYADDILLACPCRASALASYSVLNDRVNKIGLKIKESPDEAIFDLASGHAAELLGFRVRVNNDGQMRTTLSDKSWDKLEISLAETSFRSEKLNDKIMPCDVKDIGFGWLTQKAIAFDQAQVPTIADKIRNLSLQSGLDMSAFTDELAQGSWEQGQQQWQKARDQVVGWLPQNCLLN